VSQGSGLTSRVTPPGWLGSTAVHRVGNSARLRPRGHQGAPATGLDQPLDARQPHERASDVSFGCRSVGELRVVASDQDTPSPSSAREVGRDLGDRGTEAA
jgi:hypothetical protein